MPSSLPRLNLTLPHDVADALRSLAGSLGKPQSTIVTELLTTSLPQLQALARMVTMVHVNPLASFAELEAMLTATAAATAQQSLQLDELRPLAKRAAKRAAKRPAGVSKKVARRRAA